MTCQLAANQNWDISFHLDLKTAFLQGESYDVSRHVICQLPLEAGYPARIGARLKYQPMALMMLLGFGGIDWILHCGIMG